MKKMVFTAILLSVAIWHLFAQTWESTNGPTNRVGVAFAVHNTHWFSATDGGVFRSDDAGQTWYGVLPDLHCPDILVDGNRIWVANFNGLSYSDDDGNTWAFSSVATGYRVTTICKHNGTIWIGTQNDGAYRLSGGTWIPESNGLLNADHKYLLQMIEHKGDLYAAGGQNVYHFNSGTNTWDSLATAGSNLPYPAGFPTIASDGTNLYTAVYGWGFYYSTNDGLTWTQKNAGLMSFVTGGINKLTTQNGTVWAGGVTGLYKHTAPFTGNWQTVDAGFDIYGIYADNTLLAAGGNPNGFSFSTDNGTTWQTGNMGMNDYIQAIATDGTNVFTAGIGSMISKYNGGTWTAINNFGTVQSPGGVGVGFHNGKVYASRYGTLELYRSANAGTTWTQISTGIPAATTAYFIKGQGNHLYAHFSDNSLYRSDNEGATWSMMGLAGHFIGGIAFENSNIWAATDSGVFASTNLGVTWTYQGLYDKKPVTIAYTNGRILVGTADEGIYISDDNGTTWTLSNTGLSANYILSFYATGDFILAGTYGYGMSYSQDKGNTWADVNTGLGDYYITSITMKGNEAYIGTIAAGVWKADMSLILAVEDKIKPSFLSLYPNPSTGNFTLTSSLSYPKASLSIRDIFGKTLVNEEISLTKNTPQQFEYPLTSGLYFVEILTDDHKEVKKWVIK